MGNEKSSLDLMSAVSVNETLPFSHKIPVVVSFGNVGIRPKLLLLLFISLLSYVDTYTGYTEDKEK